MFHVKKITTDTVTEDKYSGGAVFIADCTGGDVTLTLSTLANTGTTLFAKKEDSSNNLFTIDGGGVDIDGCDSIDIVVQNEAYMIVRSDDGWEIV